MFVLYVSVFSSFSFVRPALVVSVWFLKLVFPEMFIDSLFLSISPFVLISIFIFG